jgi:D-alanyl-D-alanine carboxypeptidase/D-alanyl-D-alanine-endopeptidase (penicillin-binding protein 4)
VGILAVEFDGDTIFSLNPEKLLVPASNEKLLLTAALLHHLGPIHTFKTVLLRDSVGNLYLSGGGDPLLSVGDLYEIALRLKLLGITEVGTLFVDESYLDTIRYQPGWTYFEVGSHHAPPLGALSLERNLVEVKVRGDTLETYPPVGWLIKELNLEGDTILPAEDPAIFTGAAFLEILRSLGVEVSGLLLKKKVEDGCDTLIIHQSPLLSEIIRVMNKRSDNFIAEMLLKDLGAEVFGLPGTREKGVSAIHLYLSELGIDTPIPQGR